MPFVLHSVTKTAVLKVSKNDGRFLLLSFFFLSTPVMTDLSITDQPLLCCRVSWRVSFCHRPHAGSAFADFVWRSVRLSVMAGLVDAWQLALLGPS